MNLLKNNGWKCLWRGHPAQPTDQLKPPETKTRFPTAGWSFPAPASVSLQLPWMGSGVYCNMCNFFLR